MLWKCGSSALGLWSLRSSYKTRKSPAWVLLVPLPTWSRPGPPNTFELTSCRWCIQGLKTRQREAASGAQRPRIIFSVPKRRNPRISETHLESSLPDSCSANAQALDSRQSIVRSPSNSQTLKTSEDCCLVSSDPPVTHQLRHSFSVVVALPGTCFEPQVEAPAAEKKEETTKAEAVQLFCTGRGGGHSSRAQSREKRGVQRTVVAGWGISRLLSVLRLESITLKRDLWRLCDRWSAKF